MWKNSQQHKSLSPGKRTSNRYCNSWTTNHFLPFSILQPDRVMPSKYFLVQIINRALSSTIWSMDIRYLVKSDTKKNRNCIFSEKSKTKKKTMCDYFHIPKINKKCVFNVFFSYQTLGLIY